MRVARKTGRARAAIRALSAAAVLMAGSAAQGAVLDTVPPGALAGATTLFTTDWKRDQNVNNPGQRGHDLFLSGGPSTSAPKSWGASGTVYDWALHYDGDRATLVFDGTIRSINVIPDGSWEAVQFYLRADDTNRFDTSSVTVDVTQVNGSAVTGATRTETDGAGGIVFAQPGGGAIASLAGTMRFDFTVAQGATGSPNARYRVGVSALDLAAVPVPAALPLLALGLGGLGYAARRQRRRA